MELRGSLSLPVEYGEPEPPESTRFLLPDMAKAFLYQTLTAVEVRVVPIVVTGMGSTTR